MKKILKILSLILYYGLASKLPSSSFPLGSFFNWVRIFTLQSIVPIGMKCKIQRNVYFGDGNDVEIGNNCQINDNVRLDNVIIHENVMIARDCVILGKMHEFSNVIDPMIVQGKREVKKTIIDNDVWIGLRAIIMPGIHIKKGCIIGAGAILTKDTEEFGIYAGIPAKKIKTRNPD